LIIGCKSKVFGVKVETEVKAKVNIPTAIEVETIPLPGGVKGWVVFTWACPLSGSG